MRIIPGALGLLAAGVVTLTGCTAPAAAPPPATVTVATPSPVAPPPSAPPSTSAAPQNSGPCTLDALRAELGTPAGGPAGGQNGQASARTVDIVWTNASQNICTMRGFGGADLQRSPKSRDDLTEPERTKPDRFSLRRSDADTPEVRLAPGEKAHSTITFMSSQYDLSNFGAETILVTPPNETRSAVLKWPDPEVLRDSATLGPVRSGAS